MQQFQFQIYLYPYLWIQCHMLANPAYSGQLFQNISILEVMNWDKYLPAGIYSSQIVQQGWTGIGVLSACPDWLHYMPEYSYKVSSDIYFFSLKSVKFITKPDMEERSDEDVTQQVTQGTLLDILHTASSSNEYKASWVVNKCILNALEPTQRTKHTGWHPRIWVCLNIYSHWNTLNW